MNNNVSIDKVRLPKKGRRERGNSPLSRYAFVFFLPTAAAFCIGFLFPFLWGIYLSFFQFRTINKLTFVGLQNYARAMADRQFWYSFGFSALFTIVTVILINVLAFTVAYALTRSIKGKNIFRTVFFMPNLIGGIVLGFIWQIILNGIFARYAMNVTSGTANAFWGLVILTCWQQIGYMMIIYIAALGSVPEALIEAAKIDGAGSMQIFLRLGIPAALPAIFLSFLLSVVWYYNETVLSAIYFGSDFTTLPLELSKFQASYNNIIGNASGKNANEAIYMAGTFLSILPLLVFYFFTQKKFTDGIDKAGITGE